MARAPAEERLSRLLAVLGWLASHGSAHLDDLADRFGVTRHQLERDFEAARMAEHRAGSTMVEVDVAGDGTVVARVPARFREPPRLDRAEALAVVAAGRVALAITPNDALTTALEKVEAALGVGVVDAEVARPPSLAAFQQARDIRERLRISYWSAWRDAFTEREVDPIRVDYVDGEWYARCHDHRSGEVRVFRIDRVEDWTRTGDHFTPPAETGTVEFAPAAEVVHARVWFPPEARWVTEYLPLDVHRDDDTGVVGELAVVGEWWLGRLLLRTGGRVEAPDAWADLGQIAARRVLARYEEG